MGERLSPKSQRPARALCAAVGTVTLFGPALSCSADNPAARPEPATTTTLSPQERLDRAVRGRPGWLLGVKTVRVQPGIGAICSQGKPGEQPFQDTDPGVTADRSTWKKAKVPLITAADYRAALASDLVTKGGNRLGVAWVDPRSNDDGMGVIGGVGEPIFAPAAPGQAEADHAVADRIGDGPGCHGYVLFHMGGDGIPVIETALSTAYADMSIKDAEANGMA